MAKKLFNDEELFKLQVSYYYKQNKNIMEANNLRSELKTMENEFKELEQDLDNDLLNPSYEFNLINEIYSIPEIRKAYNEEFNKGIDNIVNKEYKNIGHGYEGGAKFAGTLMLIFGICTIPFFMLIFPIVLIVFGARKISDAKHSDRVNRARSLTNYGIAQTKGYNKKEIQQEFLDHMNMIKSLDDKKAYFNKFKEITPFASFVYAHHTFDELMELPCVKAKKKELKEIRANLKNACKDLLEIGKTLSDKYELGLKKLNKEFVDRATGNYYFIGNTVIMYEDDDITTFKDLFYMYDNNLSTVNHSTCYRNDNDVEKLKDSFVSDTLDELIDKLSDENIIIENEEGVYVQNPNNDLAKKDSEMVDLFLELLDATNSIEEFNKIFEE